MLDDITSIYVAMHGPDMLTNTPSLMINQRRGRKKEIGTVKDGGCRAGVCGAMAGHQLPWLVEGMDPPKGYGLHERDLTCVLLCRLVGRHKTRK